MCHMNKLFVLLKIKLITCYVTVTCKLMLSLKTLTYLPGGSMPHSQGLSNNPYPEVNQPNSSSDTYFFKIHSNSYNLLLGLLKDLFPVGFTC